MSIQTNGQAGQEPPAGSQQQGQEPSAQQGQQGGPGQESGGQQPQGADQFDLSAIQDPALRNYLEHQQAELARARQEAARYRTERGSLQEQVQQFQRASETAEQAAAREAQERQEALTALQAENRALKVGGAITTAAVAAKALDPDVVAALIGPKVELDDDGKPGNVQALVAGLQQSHPFLFRQTPGGADGAAGAAGQHPASAGGMNDFIRGGARTAAR